MLKASSEFADMPLDAVRRRHIKVLLSKLKAKIGTEKKKLGARADLQGRREGQREHIDPGGENGSSGLALIVMTGFDDPLQLAKAEALFADHARILLARGFRVASFEAPVHGAPEGNQTTMMRFVKSVGAAAQSLGDVQVIIAHSLGSIASVAAAAETALSTSLKCMILLAVPVSLTNVLERWARSGHRAACSTAASDLRARPQLDFIGCTRQGKHHAIHR